MNAKKLLVLLLFAVSLSGVSSTTDPPPTGADRIELMGLLDINHGPNDVEAFADQNFVYIYFHQVFGVVCVSLYNEAGMMIHNDVVNTAIQQQLVIPITGLVDGVYTVVLENATGYADGEFEKTNN